MSDLTCKRCGCPHVRWMKTNAGRWYLAAHYDVSAGGREASAYAHAARKRPHTCNCGHSDCRARVVEA